MQKSAIAENVRRIISNKGMKQVAVAQRAGFSEKQLSDILNNRKIIRDVDVIAIANALEVTPNDLFGISNA